MQERPDGENAPPIGNVRLALLKKSDQRNWWRARSLHTLEVLEGLKIVIVRK